MPLKQFNYCPSCKATDMRRSRRRNVVERIISVVLLPCRCGTCGFRTYRFRWQMHEVQQPAEEKAKSASV